MLQPCTAAHAARQRNSFAIFTLFFTLLVVLATTIATARAQDAPPPPPLLKGGDGVITGFSGAVEQAGKPFINLDGASAKIKALSRTGPPFGQLEVPPVRREIPAREVGQVFGIAIDNLVPANVYLGATAAFGLRIVTPDADEDGIPEIALKGQPDARWMEGQWGPGGGPGSIWKVNGATGVVELFATIPNSGPGLGNIAYDPFRYQLFVSNLDDGLVYRLDLNGNILDTYDHGTTGRAAAGMTPVADDGSKADITSPTFSVENTNTWGLTDIRRQVWGLAVHGDRLYYAVAIGPEGGAQIWSVGINIDGSLAADARVEIAAVPGGLPVSDMLFTPAGRMILAQRGMFLNSLDNTRFHIPGADRVLRYRRDPKTGQWIQEPQEYAVGFPRPYRNASGGVALSCAGRLWVSGDQLRNDPEVVPDPPFVVHGLQRMYQRLVRPRNMPPFAAVFVDYDGIFGDARNAGHVGDVEVYRDCIGTPRPPVGWLPAAQWITPGKPGAGVWTPPDLFKQGLECVRDPETGDLLCDYAIYAYNWKKEPRTGGMIFYDIPAAGVSFEAVIGVSLSAGGSIGFSCSQSGGPGQPIKCESSGSFSLDFGAFVEVKLRTRIPAESIDVWLPKGEAAWKVPALFNCVAWETDGTPGACTVSRPKDPWPVPQKELVYCEKADDGSQQCTMLLTFRNDGAATFEGAATITDHVGPDVSFVRDDDGFDTDGFTPLSWTCTQPDGAGGPIECKTDAPVTVAPGEQVDVLVTVNIPADARPEAYRDCAVIDERGPRACIDVAQPPRLTPRKERKECRKSDDAIVCEYIFRIRNEGVGAHDGILTITDSVGPTATLITMGTGSNGPDGAASWTCAQPGGAGNPITCTSDDPMRLDPGEEVVVGAVAIRYPPDAKPEDIADCAFIEEGGPKACLPGDLEKPKLDLGKALQDCRREGENWICTYTITITNTGGGAYSGLLNFSDDVGPQTTYVSHDPAAGWTCNQAGVGADIECNSNAAVNLAPGASVSVNITTSTPLGLEPEKYKDCAKLRVDGHEGGQCVDSPPPPPPPPDGGGNDEPRLERTKTLKGCRMDGELLQCTFVITITNTGSAPYNGTLRFLDMTEGGSWTYQSTATPGWRCTQLSTAMVRCESTSRQTLAPGASQTVEITMTRPGEPDGDRTGVNNCVMKYDEGHERSCVAVKIPIPEWDKKLKECIRKDDGIECTFTFTMRNTGEADYVGEGRYVDMPSEGGRLVSSNPPAGWSCAQERDGAPAGHAPSIICTSSGDITIPPGGSVSGELTVRYPLGEKKPFNCWLPYHVDETKRCIDIDVPDEPELRTEKDDAECTRQGDAIRCTWNIRVTNVGSGSFSGDIIVGDMLPVPSATLVGTPTGSIPWSCTTRRIAFRCEGNTTLAPGESATLQATFTFPADSVANYQQVRNCAVGGRLDALPASARRKQAGQGNLLPFMAGKQSRQPAPDDNICERVRLPEGLTCDCGTGQLPPEPPTGQPPSGKPNLDISKTGIDCRREGEDAICRWRITVTNRGDGAYNGRLRLREELPRGETLQGIEPADRWTCAGGECTSNDPLTIAPGGSVEVVVTVRHPASAIGNSEAANEVNNCVSMEQLQSMRKNAGGASSVRRKSMAGNTRSCNTQPVPEEPGQDTPPSGQPRLNLNKESAGCTREANLILCTWRITITNTGDAPYTGRLTVADFAPGSGFVSASGSDGLSWTCVSSILTSCQSAETTLAPGASTTLTLTTAAGVPAGQTKVPNCAFTRPPDGTPSAGASGGDINVDGLPRLLKEKSGQSGRAKSGGLVIDPGSTGTGADRDGNAQNFVDNFCNPDSGMVIRPFPGGGCDCAIAQIPQAQPVSKPVCPSDTQTFPKAVQLPQGFKVVKTLPDGTQCARHEQAGDTPATSVPGVQPPPVVVTPGPGFVSEKPECRANERTLKTRREARRYAKRGWNVREVSKSGTTIWCATQPARAKCKDGWQPVSGADLRKLKKQGWRFYSITRKGRVVQWCGKPGKTPSSTPQGCPDGWQSAMPNPNYYRERGWQVRRFGNEWCMKPRRNTQYCREGGRVVQNYDKAMRLRRQGWHVDFVRGPGPDGTPYWCVYGRTQCPNDWMQLSKKQAKRRDAQGWSIRVINGVYCGKPGQTPSPTCPQGYRSVNPGDVAALRKQGWSLRRIARNKWCGKRPDSATGGGTRCIGGTLKRGQCLCPRGKKPKLVSPPLTHVPRGGIGLVYRCVPDQAQINKCPSGMEPVYSRDGKRIVACTAVAGVRCPSGTKRKGNRCVSDQTQPARDECRRPAFRSGNTCACPRGYQRKVLARLGKGRVIGCEQKPSTVVVPPAGGGTGGQGVFCRKGFVKRNGKCVPRRCGKGFIRTNRGTCIPVRINPDVLRDLGRVNRQRTQPRKCPQGTVRTRSGRCIPVRINPDVLRDLGRVNGQRTQPRKCPRGTVRVRSGRCIPVRINPNRLRDLGRVNGQRTQPRKCPRGTVRTKRGVCVPVRIKPDVLRNLQRNTGKPRQKLRVNRQIQGRASTRVKCGKGLVFYNGRCVPQLY